MTFGDKVRTARKKMHLDQGELADRLGITRRMISAYENDQSRPHGYAACRRLADALGLNVNYLLDDDEVFIEKAQDIYGRTGAEQARQLMAGINGLFSGGNISDDDMDEFMRAVQDAYWEAKKRKKKYVPFDPD